jgi:hypothetical protein
MAGSPGFALEWITVGVHRSSIGPCLNGQPAPILTAKLMGVAPAKMGTRRMMTVRMMILDFMIFISNFVFSCH